MDYDDNDFESRNPQLAGEGSIEFPPVLQPYALPKYDFDDSLREHLRFDNLVESEVFLGIESQEHNQWIEDFSQGSSQIEFASGAAASCPISRHNNVWSEATSLESVEMLLKSVGQEEMIPGQTIAEESEVSDKLGSSTKQIDPVLEQPDNIISSANDVTDFGPTLPPYEILNSSSGLNEDSVGIMQVEDTLHAFEGEAPGPDNLRSFDQDDVERCGPVAEGNQIKDGKLDDANQREGLCDEALDSRILEDSSTSQMQRDDHVTSVQPTDTIIEDPNTERTTHQENHYSDEDKVGNENYQDEESRIDCQNMHEDINSGVLVTSVQPTDTIVEDPNTEQTTLQANHYSDEDKVGMENDQDEESQIDCQNMHEDINSGEYNMEEPLVVAHKIKSVEINKVGTNLIDMDPSSIVIVKGNSDPRTLVGCSASACPLIPAQECKLDAIGPTEDSHTDDHFKANMHQNSPMALEGDCHVEVYAGETDSYNSGIDANIEMQTHSYVQINDKLCRISDRTEYSEECGKQMDSMVSVSKSKASLLSTEDSKYFEVQSGETDNYNSRIGANIETQPHSYMQKNDELCMISERTGYSEECNKQMDSIVSVSKSEPSLLSIENSKYLEVQSEQSNNSLMMETSISKVVSSSSELETQVNLKLEGIHDTLGVSGDGSNVDDQDSSSLLAKSIECEGNLVKGQDDSINSEQGYSRVDEVTVAKAQFTSTAGNLFSSDDSMKNIDRISNDTLDGCLMSTENVACSLEAVDPKDDGKSISATKGPALNDNKEEVANKISVGAVLTINEGSQVVSRLGPVLKSGNDAYHGTAGDGNNEEHDQSQVAEENIVNMSETLDTVADKVVEDNLTEQESHHVFCDSTAKEDLVAVGALKSCDEEAAKEIYEETLSEVLDKHTCGSPTAISCVETCKQGKEGGDTGHLEQSVTITNVSGDSKNDCSVSQDRNDNVSTEQVDFSFDVRSLADKGDAAKDWHQSTSTEASKLTPIVERTSSVSGLGRGSSMKVQDVSHANPQSNNREIKLGGSRGIHERKPRRTSGKATGKESAKRGNHVKLSTPMRQLQVDKSSTVSPGSSLACQLVQSEGMQHTEHVEQCSKNTPNVLTTPTSSLPDLNTSAALIAVFQPSFTGSQQVQLRAQIFVYGSLIQGTAPEEACMISAFGDGGRGMWEKAWRVSLERLQDQKCNPNNPETPLQQLSGTRSPDHANKQVIIQSNIISSPIGRASSKSTSSPAINSTMPISSPLWSIPTPGDAMQSPIIARSTTMALNQMPSPLHPYMTPSIRSFVGHPWVPQSPFTGSWVPSQVSPFSSSLRFPPLSITEPVKSTPIRESSGTHASCPKHVFSSQIFQREGVYPGNSMTPDIPKATVSPVQDSAHPKSRKRKKSSASEDLGLIYLPPQAATHPSDPFGVASHISSSVVTVSTPMSKTSKEKFVPVAATTVSFDQPKINNIDGERSDVLSEETLNNVKEAKLQAENAATLAATAVNHSQVVWDELDKQKNSGMIAESEAKLASAAVAIAAAASVAKAAAAAAKVAAAAALQAKLMAEEALFSSGAGSSNQNNITSLSSAVSVLGDATPASILKGQDGIDSSGSILIAAREAARSRVEAASAASRRAENLDAIVKAAELAAEAVTQAGKVVAMGNLPLIELAVARPNDYWKAPSGPAPNSSQSKREQFSIRNVQHVPQISAQHVEDVSIEQKGTQTASSKKPPIPSELSRFSVEDHMKSVDGSSGEGDERGHKGSKDSVIAETVVVIPESNRESRNSSTTVQEQENTVGILSGKTIKVGSLVEVFKGVDSSKAAWCLASVLSLKGGEAYVCYTETPSGKGEGQLKEWVSLKSEGNNAPRIRIPHPMTTILFEGSKKRSREAMVNYTWSVGDKVDACIDDCWCEGVVTEKNKKDETTLTVHFPAQGKTSIVRAWKLRPSLLWKEGQWIEWSNLRENNLVSHEGDRPREKRRKIGSPAVESKEKDSVSADINVVESVTEGTMLLDLRANEKTFNIGKNTKGESSKLEPLRTERSGLKKEGSRKVFGIPKPVKKRKFMEVSKHYIADKSTNKTSVGNYQVKLANVPIPRESGTGGWRNTKIDCRDRIPADSTKLRAFKTGKTQSVSTSQDRIFMDRRTNLKGSASLNENASGKQGRAEFGSFSKNEGQADGPNLLSLLPVPPDVSSKKVSTSSSKLERVSKEKLAPSAGKLAKIQEDKVYNSNTGKSIPDGGVEPRRSNRRIQPTSRMLEGLQSSLSSSNYKLQNKSLSSSRGNNHR